MFTPGQIEGIPLPLEQQFSDLENRVMQDVVRRLKNNGNDIIRSADWQLHRLQELGASKAEIKKYLQDTLHISDKEIDRIYSGTIAKGYTYDEKLYKAVGAEFVAFKDNKELQQLISAISAQTKNELSNITQSLGFAVRKPNGALKFTEISKYYQQTLDGAVLDITSGVFDYNTVLKRVVREMTNSGLRSVDYASGVSKRIVSAARTAIMTGVSQVTSRINDDNAKALKTDMFEVTWHSGARPSHQEWQGKWYTKAQLVSICGLGTVTGLGGANCYHDRYPVIPGISERAYTDEQLKQMNVEENTPHEFGGKSYTKYEALQKQRKLETTMRAQRQEINLLKEGGANEDDIITARCRYRVTSSEYTRFSSAMNLRQQRDRVTVDGLGNIGAGKFTAKPKSAKINVLPNVSNAEIPTSKLTEYALNPLKDANKSNAFKQALGYDTSNADKLITNIKSNVNRFNALEKPDNGYGKRYEVLMTLKGENGKTANVKTAWIVDKDTGKTRLTSAYVTKKKFKENEND